MTILQNKFSFNNNYDQLSLNLRWTEIFLKFSLHRDRTRFIPETCRNKNVSSQLRLDVFVLRISTQKKFI
jgi:hypothetical protein